MAGERHVGRWILTGSENMGGWRPPAGLAIFEPGGAYSTADLDGDDSSGVWLADDDEVITEDPALGQGAVWKYGPRDDSLMRILSDEETGGRGGGAFVYARATPESFGRVLARHLQRIPGVGRALGARLAAQGLTLRRLRALTEDDAPRLAATLGLPVERLRSLAAASRRL